MSDKDIIKTDDFCGPGELFTTGPQDPMATSCQYHDFRYKYRDCI